MAIPALEKTWQHTGGQLVTASGNSLTDNRTVLLGMVNAMLGFASSPWTVIASAGGSSPGAVVAGFDGVNRWTSITQLTYTTTSGNHSWIVLQQSGINAKTQLCIDLLSLNASNSSTGLQLRMHMSPALGFGAVNGGTDGTAALKPTALDEFPLHDNASNRNWLVGGTTTTNVSRNYVWYGMQSTDGQCTRFFVRLPFALTSGSSPPNGGLSAVMVFDKPKNPVSGWTNPAVGVCAANIFTTPTPIDKRLGNAALFGGRSPAGVNMSMYMAGFDMGGNLAHERIPQNDISGEIEFYPCRLASTTAGAYGIHGELFDMYWVSDKHLDGDTFPATGSPRFMALTPYAIPTNTSTPVLF